MTEPRISLFLANDFSSLEEYNNIDIWIISLDCALVKSPDQLSKMGENQRYIPSDCLFVLLVIFCSKTLYISSIFRL